MSPELNYQTITLATPVHANFVRLDVSYSQGPVTELSAGDLQVFAGRRSTSQGASKAEGARRSGERPAPSGRNQPAGCAWWKRGAAMWARLSSLCTRSSCPICRSRSASEPCRPYWAA